MLITERKATNGFQRSLFKALSDAEKEEVLVEAIRPGYKPMVIGGKLLAIKVITLSSTRKVILARDKPDSSRQYRITAIAWPEAMML